MRVMLLNWGKYSEAFTVQIVRRLSACFGTSSASARRKSPVAVQEVRQYRTAQISLEAGQCWVKSELAERWRPKLGQMGVAPLIVDAGDKSSHRSRVLRAAICETMENQARSIIWCSLTFRKNPLRQFPSFSKLASFQMKSQEECEKARRMLYGQEQILITLFNCHNGNAGNLKPVRDQFSRLKSGHQHSHCWNYPITSCLNIRGDWPDTGQAWIWY